MTGDTLVVGRGWVSVLVGVFNGLDRSSVTTRTGPTLSRAGERHNHESSTLTLDTQVRVSPGSSSKNGLRRSTRSPFQSTYGETKKYHSGSGFDGRKRSGDLPFSPGPRPFHLPIVVSRVTPSPGRSVPDRPSYPVGVRSVRDPDTQVRVSVSTSVVVVISPSSLVAPSVWCVRLWTFERV